jgi:hypothetical protein
MPKLKDVIEDLITSYGLRKCISSREYECMYHDFLLKEYGQCVRRIKKFFNLKMVEVRILYVSNEEMLESLSEQERREIELYKNTRMLLSPDTKDLWSPMRISIPENIPLYGAKEFRGLSVVLRINTAHMDKSFDNFLVDAAHEMSHILMHATRNRWQHSEKAVDILLMLQGFMEVNERVYESGIHSYLTPAEVRGICDYVRKRGLE